MMRLRQSVEWTSDILAVVSLWLEEQDGHGEIERLVGGAVDRTHLREYFLREGPDPTR